MKIAFVGNAKSASLLVAILLIALNSGCMQTPQESFPSNYIPSSTIPPYSIPEHYGYTEATTTTTPTTTISTSTLEYTTTTIQYVVEKPIGENRLTIASWNIQRYGPTKASNTDTVKYLASKINNYDIVILEEITDESGAAFNKLCTYLNDYHCIASDRFGNTSYKEQYGIIYKNADLIRNSPIATNNMERYPIWLTFKSGNWTFNLIAAHTQPTNDEIEMKTLDYILNQPVFQNDTILIGDLNADCSYYTTGNDFTNWLWAIPNGADTTVGTTNCAYDRLIINKATQNNYHSYGIDKSIPSSISDHYLIYGIFDNSIP